MSNIRGTRSRAKIIMENGRRIYLSPATIKFIKSNDLTVREFRQDYKIVKQQSKYNVNPDISILKKENRSRLKAILLEKSYREGTFTLTSGLTSDFYIECKVTALDDEGGFLIGTTFSEMISRECPAAVAVAGMTLGAEPLVSTTSLCSYLFSEYNNLKALIIRKEAKDHGTKEYIEGTENVPKGSVVAVIDDVSKKGGSLVKSVERIQSAGYIVGIVISLVHRQEGAVKKLEQETGQNLRWVFTREELLASTKN